MGKALLVIFILMAVGVPSSWGADEPFSISREAAAGVRRLADEAGELASLPFDRDGGLLGTVAVAGAVGLTYLFDDDIRDRVAGVRGGRLDRAADAASLLGNPLVHLGIAAAVYGGGAAADSPRHRELGEMLGEAVLLADGASFILKEATGRARPLTGADKDRFRPFQFRGEYDSLPSMHTASSFAMASVLAATSDSLAVRFLSYAAAGFVGFARIYQDKHWASDVVLGAALGELSGRVVTRYHAGGNSRVAIVPYADGSRVGLGLTGRF